MFRTRTRFLLVLLWLVCGTLGQSPNYLYGSTWTSDGDLTSNPVFKYHLVNKTAEYRLATALGSFESQPVNIYGVFVDIDINGQKYHWEQRANCVLDSSLCPLPSRETSFQITFTPDFNFPDSVWSTPNQRIGQIRVQVGWASGGFPQSAETQSAALQVGIERTGPPRAGPSSSNHSSSGPITPYSPFATSSHSPAVSWVTGIITVALAAASGALALWGHMADGSDMSPPPSHVPGGDAIDAIAVGAAAQSALAVKAVERNMDGSHASSEKFEGHMAGIIANRDPGPPVSWMDPLALFLYFQFVSTTGLLSLKYPPIYRAFTVNFAWANFMLPIQAFIRAGQRARKCNITEFPPGIAGYAAELGISPQEVFIVVYCVFLCICLILLGVSLLVGLTLQLVVVLAASEEKRDKFTKWRILWQQMMSNNTLRLMHLGLGSLAIFFFWLWTLKCVSPIIAFASATAFLLIMGSLSAVSFLIVRLAARPGGVLQLFTKESSYARRWGTLYNSLNDNRVSFVIPLLTSVLIRSAIVGFGQGSGLAQLIALIILEATMCIGLFRYKPYYSPGYNRVNYMLKGTGVISHLLLLPFIDQINLKPNPARALGIFILVIHSLVALVLFVLTVLKLGWGVVWFRKKHIAFESNKGQTQKPLSKPSDTSNENR